MTLNLNTLVGKLAKTDIEYMGYTTKVTYDPNYLTQTNIAQAEEDENAFNAFFVKLVRSWDVTKGGKKVPLTVNAMKDMPLLLLRAVYNGILSQAGDTADEAGKASNAS